MNGNSVERPRAFLSHSKEDKGVARSLATKLRAQGIDAWFDEWEIRPGDSLQEKVFSEGIKDTPLFVILVSRNSIKSRWVKSELDAAQIQRLNGVTRVVPVRLDRAEMPTALLPLSWLDMECGLDDVVHRLVNVAYGISEKPLLGSPPASQLSDRRKAIHVRATNSRPLRWLHISDLHLREGDTYTQDIVLNALLRSFADSEPLARHKPDLVFCTGDIAFSGKVEQYREAAHFFDRLASVTGVSHSRMFVVPGNHDLDRGRVSRRFHFSLESIHDVDEFFGPSDGATEDRVLAWRRFAAYSKFHDELFGSAPSVDTPYSVWRLSERGHSVGVIGLNTAWLALEGVGPGGIVVGERVVRAALSDVAKKGRPDLVVALLHHPLEWLAEFERSTVEDLLFEGCDLVLYGHLHQDRPWGLQAPGGSVALLGVGAAFQGRDRRWPNGAFVGELDDGGVRIQGLRFYERSGGIWAPDPELSPRTGGAVEIELRAATASVTASPTSASGDAFTTQPERPAPDIARYLRHVELTCGSIELTGLLSERAAASVPLESVYVSLSATWPGRVLVARPEDVESLEEDNSYLLESLKACRDEKTAPDPDEALREVLLRLLVGLGVAPHIARTTAAQDRLWIRLHERFRVEESPLPVHDLAESRDSKHAWIADVLRVGTIDDLFLFSERLLLEGDPGSGKTTQLKHVAIALVAAHRGRPERAEAMGFVEPFPIPILVVLHDFAGWIEERYPRRRAPGSAKVVLDYLDETLADVSGARGWLGEALEEGRVLMLFDGMDEVSERRSRKRVSQSVHDLLGTYDRCRVILTSRPAGLSPEVLTALRDLPRCQVEPLDDEQVSRFVHAWYHALISDPTKAKDRADDLVIRIKASESVRALAPSPIMLTVIAVVHQTRGRLPERKADLYEQCVNALADLWDHARGVRGRVECTTLKLPQKRSVFQELAWGAHTRGPGDKGSTPRIERDEALGALRGVLGMEYEVTDEACSTILDHLGERSGLVIPDGPTAYRFRHLTFQEFLTARRICDRETEPWKELPMGRLVDPWWREVVLLAPAIKAMGASADARRFVEMLFSAASDRRYSVDRRANAYGLVARALCDLREYEVLDLQGVYESVKEGLAALVSDREQPGELWARIAMAEALGWFGDPRLADEQRWVTIPGGSFLYDVEEEDVDSEKRTASWVDIPTFQIQRWPTTVGEYAEFVNADDFCDLAWWDDIVPAVPKLWPAQLASVPNRPVVGVSWYGARAWCRWQSARISDCIQLPSVVEWRKAARGGEQLADGMENLVPLRAYPWGDVFDKTCLNSFEQSIGDVTPVGVFPAGAAPDGVLDMTGNVFEWLSGWGLEGEEIRREYLNMSDSKLACGGSWSTAGGLINISLPIYAHPSANPDIFGFRPMRHCNAPGSLCYSRPGVKVVRALKAESGHALGPPSKRIVFVFGNVLGDMDEDGS